MQFHECAFDFCGDEFAGLATMFSSCFSRLRPRRRSATIHQTLLWGPISWALFEKKEGNYYKSFAVMKSWGEECWTVFVLSFQNVQIYFAFSVPFFLFLRRKASWFFVLQFLISSITRSEEPKIKRLKNGGRERRGTTHFPINLPPPLTDYYTPST